MARSFPTDLDINSLPIFCSDVILFRFDFSDFFESKWFGKIEVEKYRRLDYIFNTGTKFANLANWL